MGALAWVEVLDHRGQVRHRHRVDTLPALIGRGYGCDILIDDPWVSPIHVRLYRDLDGSLQLEDAGSENGLWIPGRAGRIRAMAADPAVKLRAGRTTFRVVAAESPVAPTLGANAEVTDGGWWERPIPAVALTLLTGLCFGYGQLLEDSSKHLGGEVVADALGLALGLAAWAGIWALVTRAVAHRARFSAHLSIVSAVFLALFLVVEGAETGAFLFPGAVTSEGLMVIPWLSASIFLIYAHLSIASTLSRARAALVSSGIVFGLVAIAQLATSNDKDDGPVSTLDFVSNLKPVNAALIPAQDTTDFFDGLSKLKSKVDSLAVDEE